MISREAILDRLPGPVLSVAVNAAGAWYRANRYSGAMRATQQRWSEEERISPGEVESRQVERLRRILVCAQQASFYRDRFLKARFDPERLTSLRQLEDLPLLSREEVIERRQDMIVPTPAGAWVDARSSGTTGTPLSYRLPRHLAYDERYAMLYQFYAWHGFQPLQRRATIAGRYLGRKPGGVTAINRMENQLLLGVHALNVDNVDRYARALERFRPRLLQGHPSALRRLVDLAEEAGVRLPVVPLLTVTGETLLETDRDEITRAFNGSVFGTYGMGETCIAGCECEALDGYHVHPAIGVTELVGAAGQAGEIVATSLLNDVMPLVRYRTGDLASELDPTPCSCGRTWPRLKGLLGRVDDKIVTAGGAVIIPVTLRTDVGHRFKGMPPYSIIQHRDKNRYTVRFYSSTLTENSELPNAMAAYLQKLFGPGSAVAVDIRTTEEFLTRRAKHKIVIREEI
jgi:phenylacetate-CoA ligase